MLDAIAAAAAAGAPRAVAGRAARRRRPRRGPGPAGPPRRGAPATATRCCAYAPAAAGGRRRSAPTGRRRRSTPARCAFADELPPAERARLLEPDAYEMPHRPTRWTRRSAAWRGALEIWRQLGDRCGEGEASLAGARLVSPAGTPRPSRRAGRALEAARGAAARAAARDGLQRSRPNCGCSTATPPRRSPGASGPSPWPNASARRRRWSTPSTRSARRCIVAGDERGPRASRAQPRARPRRRARHAASPTPTAISARRSASSTGSPHAERYLTEGIAYSAEHDLDYARLLHAGLAGARPPLSGPLARGDRARRRSCRPAPARLAISRIMALVALGRVRARRGDPDAAVLLDEALALAEQTGDVPAPGARPRRPRRGGLAGRRPRAALAEARRGLDLAVRHQHAWHLGDLGLLALAGRRPRRPAAGRRRAVRPPDRRRLGRGRRRWERWAARTRRARALAEATTRRRCAARWPSSSASARGRRRPPPAAACASRRRAVIPRGPRPATRANPAGLTRARPRSLACSPRAAQRRDRRAAVLVGQDGRPPRLGDPRQARRPRPHRSGRGGGAAGPARPR